KLAVRYRVAEPARGMHFVLPSASRPKRPLMVYTQGEPLEARYWLPTHDWPNQRWTSDILVTVPAPLTAVATGVLQSREPTADGKAVTFHWRNDLPTAPHPPRPPLGHLAPMPDPHPPPPT